MTARAEHLDDLHHNGVHIECHPAHDRRKQSTARSCHRAGGVERFHSHSFEGPLICGCDDFASEGITNS